MATKIARQTMAAIWIPPDGGLFNAAIPFQRGQVGMGDITLPGAGGRTTFYGTDPFGNPIPLGFERAAPAQPAATIENYIGLVRDAIQKDRDLSRCRYVQLRIHCGMSLDHPNGWEMLFHFGHTQIGDGTISAPVSREYGDARIGQSHPIQPFYHIQLIDIAPTKITTSEVNDLNGIAFLSDLKSCGDCGGAYPGPDMIGYIACDAVGAGTANILYTNDGGATWAVTTADPFTTDEAANFPVLFQKSETEFRLVVARVTTDAGNAAEIGWDDITYGAENTTTWNLVDVGSNNGDVITALYWPKWGRMYAATDNATVHVSTDQGESWSSGTAVADVIRQFVKDPRTGNVYAVGDTNTILVEKSDSGVWEALTGPTGSNASNAIAIANDGTIWLGNGTALFYSDFALPSAAGQWTSSKDFGSNHAVKNIDCLANAAVRAGLGGDSQLLRVMVNDGTANEGDVWKTVDGGGAWAEVTNLTNAGYNMAYFSPVDPNWAMIVGEDDGSTGIIHKLSPSSGV